MTKNRKILNRIISQLLVKYIYSSNTSSYIDIIDTLVFT